MGDEILVGLASIIILGILAQWFAWRLHLPAILLLLQFGIIAGTKRSGKNRQGKGRVQ